MGAARFKQKRSSFSQSGGGTVELFEFHAEIVAVEVWIQRRIGAATFSK
jgi:hypothetical protein